MKYFKLLNGMSFPSIGFGVSEIPKPSVDGILSTAISVGYQLIDCARFYGNELEVGKTISRLNKREKLFISTKLFAQKDASKVRCLFNESINNLHTNYLDSYLIHGAASKYSEISYRYDIESTIKTWKELEKLHQEGLCKTIGLCNVTEKTLKIIMNNSSVIPHIIQIESHPYFLQKETVEFCKKYGIHITAYGAFGSIGRDFAKNKPLLVDNPVIVELAKKYQTTPITFLLAFGISRGITVLAKSSSEERMRANLSAISLEISKEDLELVHSFKHKVKYTEIVQLIRDKEFRDEYWDKC